MSTKKGKKPDMKMSDIARIAGVAKSTVSRALADSDQVSESTKARIRLLVTEHNYQINVAAQDLRRSQSRTVKVLILLGATGGPHFNDPFVMELVSSIADTLSDKSYNMLLSKTPFGSQNMIKEAFESQLDQSLIVIGQHGYHEELNALAKRYKPMVVYGAQLPDQQYPSVGGDNIEGARAAVKHLIKRGRRKIAFLGDISKHEQKLRHEGYKYELEHADIPYDESLVFLTPFDRLSSYAEMKRRIDKEINFDAVFGTSDVLAMSAISALHDHGVLIPDDIAVVGYDDIILAEHFSPALTTIRNNIAYSGAVLVDKALRLSAGETVNSRIIPTELIIRKSS